MKTIIKSLTLLCLMTTAGASYASINLGNLQDCPAHANCVQQCMSNPSPYGKASCIAACPRCS